MARSIQNPPSNQATDKKSNETEEIKALLLRISNQLDCMQQNENTETTETNTTNQNQSEDSTSNQELQELFKQFLSKEQMNLQPVQTKSASQQQSQSKTDQNNNDSAKLTKQTAAQALAQAQYELADELEASLKKLKQVISESEKLANKISNLLGEENNSQG